LLLEASEPSAACRPEHTKITLKARISVAGSPLDLVQPETLRFKVKEPVALLGEHRFQNVDIRIRVKGGGHVSQVYGEMHYIPQLR